MARSTTHPRHPAGADEAAAVALEPGRRHREDQAAALDLDQRGLGQHDRAHGHGGQVVELHPGRHARLRRRRGARRWPGSVASSHRAMQPGRGQDRDVARAEVLGRVLGSATVSSTWALSPVCGPCPAAVVRLGGWIGGHDDYDTAVTDTALIEPDVLERVLSTALARRRRHGRGLRRGRRHVGGAMLDDGRVEELSSGRSRGAGIRVVDGETTGFAHTADLTEAGPARRGPRPPPPWPARAAAGCAPSRSARSPATAAGERTLPGVGRQGAQARAAAPGPTTPPGPPATPSPRSRSAYGDSRRRILIANSDGLLAHDDQVRTRFTVTCVANGDTGMQTGYESLARTVGFEIFERRPTSRTSPRIAARRALTKLSARPAPSGEVPIVLAGGSGGILFHEACGHGLEADHIVKDASVYTGQVGELVASPLVTLVDDGTVARRVGQLRRRRRGQPARPQRAHRERRPHRLHVGLAAGPQGGPGVVGQRPPPELPAPADGAHDQHLPPGRHRGRRRDRRPDPHGRLRDEARRRPGQHRHRATSSSARPRPT